MSGARPLVRLVAILLLTFAVADLSRPSSCEDAVAVGTGQTQLLAADSAQAPGHGCDDCFCCSRVVRAEFLSEFGTIDGTGLRTTDPGASLVFTPTAPPYHPPLL